MRAGNRCDAGDTGHESCVWGEEVGEYCAWTAEWGKGVGICVGVRCVGASGLQWKLEYSGYGGGVVDTIAEYASYELGSMVL